MMTLFVASLGVLLYRRLKSPSAILRVWALESIVAQAEIDVYDDPLANRSEATPWASMLLTLREVGLEST
jgi:hypothetical protein